MTDSENTFNAIANYCAIERNQLESFLETRRLNTPDHPWYMTALLVVSGWIAAVISALALAATALLVFDVDIESMVILGGVAFLLGLVLLKTTEGEFLKSYGRAATLGGYIITVIAANELEAWQNHIETIAYMLSGIGLIAVLVTSRDFTTGFVAVLICHLGFSLPDILDWADRDYIYRALAAGVALPLGIIMLVYRGKRTPPGVGHGLILISLSASLPGEIAGLILELKSTDPIVIWAGKAGALIGIGFLMWHIRSRLALNSLALIAVGSLALVILLPAYGIAAASILALGIAIGDRPLFMLGVLLAAWSLSRFYYDLSLTLLFKSLLLIGAGVLLLGLWRIFFRAPVRTEP